MSGIFRSRRDREEEKRISEANAKKAASRELNTGLRPETSSSGRDPPRSNPGSAAWLRKAFKRAQERAEAEGRPLREIARERWGSLETYYELLREAEGGRSPSPKRSRRSPSPHTHRKDRRFSKPGEEWDASRRSSERRRRSDSSWKTEERRNRDVERKNQRDSSPSHKDNRRKHYESAQEKTKSPSPKEDRPKNFEHSQEKSKRESPPKEDKILSEKELNALGAKIVKAEILGNAELANKLKSKLEKAKAALAASGGVQEEQVVILTKTDARGNERPLHSDSVHSQKSQRSMKKPGVTHDKDGQRQSYFQDEDRYDLKTLFMQEKSGTAEDQGETLSRLSGRHARERLNEDFDVDDLFVSKASKASIEKDAVREKDRAIAQHQTLTKSLDTCRYCFKSSSFAKHLVIATGRKVCLLLPHNAPLTEGHCLIAPLSHVNCGTVVDEDVLEEITEFRGALMRMFTKEYGAGDVVFFETALGLKRFPHMRMEAVPIPGDEIDASPSIYFQKAIQECESEWSMNRKLITLGSKGLKRSVPKGLPYFHVDFGMENGFAHVIEDEELFPHNFAHEIIGGMLDLDHRRWKSKKSESFDEQRSRVLSFGAKWHDYDCTK